MAKTTREKIEDNPLLDVGVLSHGFAPHMRDYDIVFEAMWGEKEWGDAKGRYLCRFTYCPEARVVTSVGGEAWIQSWDETFKNYAKWEKAGAQEGYVWGVCWSMAYPGMQYIENSHLAALWSQRFGKQMHEAELETNAFILRLVFHDFSIEKISDEVGVLDKVLFPLKT
jgi:hypothetical protein